MSLIYEWKITAIRTETEGSNENSVYNINWQKSGYDSEGVEGVFEGASEVSSANTENFIAFEDLTEAKVLSWVQNGLSDEENDVINQWIQNEIDTLKKSRADYSGDTLPWT